jgi:Flp pilus assembly protein TadD
MIDDLEIWTGETLAKFLSCEPAWKPVVQYGARSIVFQKLAEWIDVDWCDQQFVALSSLHPFHLQTVIPRKELQGQMRPRVAASTAPRPPAALSLDFHRETAPINHFANGFVPAPAPVASQNGRAPNADQLLKNADERFLAGDLKGACALLHAAQQQEPDRAEILATLGSIHFQLGELKESRAAFERAVHLTPSNAVWHVQLAAVCLQQEDAGAFAGALEKSFTLNPNCLEALTLLANTNLRRGSYGNAAKVYRKALTIKPCETSFLLPLAKCLYHLGDHPGARELYQQILILEPGNALATEALQIIRNN